MDVSTTSIDGTIRKVPLEDLPKEELIKKYKGMLSIAQKARQAKDAAVEESNRLREQLQQKEVSVNNASQEIIESLTQQKLDLVTQVETFKHQNKVLGDNITSSKNKLDVALARNNELEIENQGFKRQVNRLTDENEDLITQLERLEKQIDELNKLGIEQKQLLLELEKNNAILANENSVFKNEITNFQSEADKSKELAEVQKMLSVSLEEIKKLQIENESLGKTVSELKQSLVEKNEEVGKDNLLHTIERLKSDLQEVEALNFKYREEIKEKNSQIEKYINSTDDLNVELHKNRAIVEKLKQDLVNTNSKLSDSQIISSGVTTDLQNSNEKLREKLKFFHSKIVKFAGNVKLLKQDKNILIANFKEYTDQVVLWKTQLETVSLKLADELNSIKAEKEKLQKDLSDIKSNNSQQQSSEAEILKNSNKELKEQINELIKEIEELKLNLEQIISERNELERIKKELEDQASKNEETIAELNKQLLGETTKINNLKEIVEEVNKQKQEVEEVNNGLQGRILELENRIEKLNSELESAKLTELQSNSEQIKNLEQTIDELNKQLFGETTKINNLKETVEEVNKQKQEFEEVNNGLQGRILELENRIEKLNSQLESAKLTETQLAEKSSQEIIKLVQQNKELQELNNELSAKLSSIDNNKVEANEAHAQTEGDSSTADNLQEKISLLKRENAELLTEMNEMNQALKERGETISKQQAYCDEMVKKLQVYETQVNKGVNNIALKDETIRNLQEELANIKSNNKTVTSSENDFQALLATKDEEIRNLQAEIERLSKETNYAESETLSTSTYSRSEEVNRLRDLEGSWEERYGKLRTLAIKLKGKIRELTTELTQEQNEKGEVQKKLANSIKTVQTLQTKCDQLEDDLEASKSENKSYLKKLDTVALDISKDKQMLAANEETIAKLKSEIEELTKDKTNIETWKKQVSSKVQSLKRELEANNVLKKDFEQRIAKLTSQLEEKEQALKTEIDKHKQTKNSLQESNNECKKKSVLNLEMQDYERSVKELSQRLETKEDVINKLKNQVDSHKSTISALREQTKLLEERVETQEADFNSLKSETAALKKKISDLEEVITQKETKIQLLTKSLEETRLENEELSTELSKVITEHQKINATLKAEKDYLRSQNLGLEQRLREVQDAFKLKNHELETIEAEYQAYKVRAQSVLRQNQTRDLGLEEKLNEEVAGLKTQVANFVEELNNSKLSLEQLNAENEKLKIENDNLNKKCVDLENKITNQCQEYDQLKTKHQQAVNEHAEAVRSLKLHTETLSQCYRQQLSEQEVRHNREIVELQSKLSKVPSPTERQSPPALISSMRREEGEGSESVESLTSPTVHPVPLERLLNNDSDQELSYVKKQLLENESKVAHLADLLADTEQDLAKHVQMNKLLKEEIRRQQRSVERERHAENLEYMKNVVFKFVTLGNGDERLRLVPVLNTILKLSPEETQRLTSVAKGEMGARGWTNYLPLSWSSSNKPQ